MTIVLLVEGATETALKDKLKSFLDGRAEVEGKPKTALRTKEIMSLNPGKLRRRVYLELRDPKVMAVVGLIDVYPDFASADEAKQFLRRAVGDEPRFYAHAAQYDVEAWLLPYWDFICQRLGVRKAKPGAHPEQVNLEQPPSRRLNELYRTASPTRKYIKPIEMAAILRNQDLTVAANQCPELKSLLNTLLLLAGLTQLP
ncbi:MAG: DUF4276 family protein [Anaerolineae bacterium]|nr:DUF4276 family protein [Anaerolineae bacterium]